MAKSTIRLDERRMLKDGTYPIQIVVGHGTNIYLSTGLYCPSDDWNPNTKQYVGKSAKRFNAALASMLANISNRILELKESGQWQSLSRAQLKEMLTHLDLAKPTVGVPSLYDIFGLMNEGRAERTKYIASSTIRQIEKFGYDPKKIYLEQIDRAWLEDLYRKMDLSINTKGAYLKCIRRAFGYALDHDITTNNPFRHYHIPTEQTPYRVLPIDKFRQFMHLDLQGTYPEYRDIFMLTFYLIGINTIDLSECTEDSIKDGRLEYRRHKTGKLYSIKLEPEALEIIHRYKGKKKLLSVFEKYKDYKAYQGTMNNALRRIGVPKLDKNGKFLRTGNHRKIMEPLEKDLSIYWARYSWATYAADLDIPKDTISEALGHSHGAKVTGIYIKYNRDKVDEANRRVIDYVLGSN